MTDNRKKAGSPDNRTIDIHDPNEKRNWCNALNCSEEELENAVRRVGKSASRVRQYLDK